MTAPRDPARPGNSVPVPFSAIPPSARHSGMGKVQPERGKAKLQEVLHRHGKVLLHPELQMSEVILCPLVFVAVLSRPLLLPALSHITDSDINVHGVVGVLHCVLVFFTSCSSNPALEKIVCSLGVNRCGFEEFGIHMYGLHIFLLNFCYNPRRLWVKNHLVPTAHLPLDQVAQGCFH